MQMNDTIRDEEGGGRREEGVKRERRDDTCVVIGVNESYVRHVHMIRFRVTLVHLHTYGSGRTRESVTCVS